MSDTSYTVTVPDGWTEEKFSEGLQLTRGDRQASIAMAVFPNSENVNLVNFQRRVASTFNLTDMKKVEKKNTVILTGLKQKIPVTVVLTDFREYFFVCVASGVEKKTLDGTIRSLKARPKPEE